MGMVGSHGSPRHAAPPVPLVARPEVVRVLAEVTKAIFVVAVLCALFMRLEPLGPAAARAEERMDSPVPVSVPLVVVASVASEASQALITRPPLETIVAEVWGDLTPQAMAVAFCESSHDPGVVSANGQDWGLFQINRVHRGRVAAMGYEWDDLFDAHVNAVVARHIYDEAGDWSPWTCAWAAKA